MSDVTVIFWYWWVVAVVLLVLEMFVSGAFFLWMAVSAALVGLTSWFLPDLSFNTQLLMFAVASMFAIAAFQYYRKSKPSIAEKSGLNRRELQYIDRIFTLQRPIVDGVGELSVDDTTWSIEGEDLPSGARIKVVGSRGNALLVVKI